MRYSNGVMGNPSTVYGLLILGSFNLKINKDITAKMVVTIKDIPAYINTCSKVDVKMNRIEINNCTQNALIGIPLLFLEPKTRNA